MKIKYVGPYKRIDYPVSVEQGGTVEVPADLGKSLVKQSSWEKATKPKEEKES